MKKKYYSPICDRIFSEEELLNVNSKFDVDPNNPEGNNGNTPGGTVNNGENGEGTEIPEDGVGAKISPVWDF